MRSVDLKLLPLSMRLSARLTGRGGASQNHDPPLVATSVSRFRSDWNRVSLSGLAAKARTLYPPRAAARPCAQKILSPSARLGRSISSAPLDDDLQRVSLISLQRSCKGHWWSGNCPCCCSCVHSTASAGSKTANAAMRWVSSSSSARSRGASAFVPGKRGPRSVCLASYAPRARRRRRSQAGGARRLGLRSGLADGWLSAVSPRPERVARAPGSP
jgi:hypothetical protein